MRAVHLLPVLALAAAAGGCNEYHYYDVTVTFNGNTAAGGFNAGSEIAAIQVCVMSVSGADNASKRLGPNANGLPIAPGLTSRPDPRERREGRCRPPSGGQRDYAPSYTVLAVELDCHVPLLLTRFVLARAQCDHREGVASQERSGAVLDLQPVQLRGRLARHP